ncbi:MAG: chromate transporter [Bacteroidales bacterium]|nr:chromate transporter [Bacteroidales bacterium]
MLYLRLFLVFLKIGAFTFGGGYAMISLIENEVVEKHQWLTAEEFTDILAVSQTTPGPIGINTATYTGYTAILDAGYSPLDAVLGALLASFAVLLVPVTLMLIVTRFLFKHRHNRDVENVFRSLRIAIIGLIAAAALSLFNQESFGTVGLNAHFVTSIIIFTVVFVCSQLPRRRAHIKDTGIHGKSPLRALRPSPITLLVASGIAGLVVYSFILS